MENDDRDPVDETGNNESPPSESPPSETPDSETPPSDTPPSETSDSETSDSETPDSETPDSETPDSETPDSETPDSESPDSETSAGEATAQEIRENFEPDPTPKNVLDHLLYTVSLPERAIRGTAAVVAGTVRESAQLLIPQAFRSSRSYDFFVQQMLDFMANDIGGMEAETEEGEEGGESSTQVEGYVARKTVGGFVDMAGLATLHLSPITILAVLTDVAYGSKEYLRELADELKREGIIGEDSTVGSMSDLLHEVSHASGQTAQALDMPPLSAEALEDTVKQTREALVGIDVTRVYPKAELDRMWNEIRAIAAEENVSLLGASSALSMFAMGRVTTVGRGALSTVRVAGNMFDQHILDHYQQGLTQIREDGFYKTLSESSRPYIAAVWKNFSSDRETITEDVVRGKFFVRWWRRLTSWARRKKPSDESESAE